MKIQNLLAVSFVSSLAFASFSQAGKLNVTNENAKALKVTIQAEGEVKKGETLASHTQDIAASKESMFEVNKTHLGGMTMYSLKGDTKNMFTPSSTCEHLNVDKDYNIKFTDDKMGTTCMSEEVVVDKDAMMKKAKL